MCKHLVYKEKKPKQKKNPYYTILLRLKVKTLTVVLLSRSNRSVLSDLNKRHSSENGQVQKLDWKQETKQPISKENLWKIFKMTEELLFQTLYYNKVCVLEGKI